MAAESYPPGTPPIQFTGKVNRRAPGMKVSQFMQMQAVRKPAFVGKIGRNAKCPCGSGKKFKYCCLPNAKQGVAQKFLGPEQGGEKPKPGNEPCTCGSGRRYDMCCSPNKLPV